MHDVKRGVQVGDVYAVPLPEGWYGAIRILRLWEDGSALVFTSTYLDQSPPALSDPRLKSKCDHWLALEILYGNPPSDLVLVGNMPVSTSEEYLTSDISGEWGLTTGFAAYFNKLKAEGKSQKDIDFSYRPPVQRRIIKRTKPMSKNEFWDIIQISADSEKQIEMITQHLATLSDGKILGFHCRLSEVLYSLDTKKHAENLGPHSYGLAFSADEFLYVRCAVVSRGRAFYEQVLHDPSLMPAGSENEGLLSVARSAYERKVGKQFNCACEHDYETFANNAGWGE